MDSQRLVAASAIALAVTLIAIFSMRPWARKVGLVDRPNERKHHKGSVPLIGGICFFLGTLVGLSYLGYLDGFVMSLMMGSALMVAAGVADDICDVSVRTRILVEAAIIGLVILSSGIYIDSLGEVLPGVSLSLGLLGVPVTIIALIGLINAFNMLDGIDGLAASVAMVAICAILVYGDAGWSVPGVALLLPVLFAALVPYLCVNLGWPDGRKVFMGDAGSTLIGFMIGWSIIYLSHPQAGGGHLAPADVLWCVAVPVLDTFGVMYRRIRQGRSPFSADRQHIHHLLIDAGLSPRRALLAIVLLSTSLAALGYLLRGAPPLLNVGMFAMVAAAYVMGLPLLLARYRPRRGLARLVPSDALMDINDVSSVMGAGALESGSGALVLAHEHARGHLAAGLENGYPEQVEIASAEQPLKVLCVLGASAGPVGMAPIARQLLADPRFHSTVCVAELPAHQSEAMLRVFDIRPHVRIQAADDGSDPAEVTTTTLIGMKRLLDEVQPDVMLVSGHASTNLAASLAAYYGRVPLVCINDEPSGQAVANWPHQGGRKIIHALAAMHVATSEAAGRRLATEGVPPDRIIVSGSIGRGTLRTVLEHLRNDTSLSVELASRFPFLRGGSPLLLAFGTQGTDEECRHLSQALAMIARRRPDVDIIWPSPSIGSATQEAEEMLRTFANVHVMEVSDYMAWVHLLDRAYLVLTGSAVLPEGQLLGKPVVTMKDEGSETPGATAGRILTLLSERTAYEALCVAQGNCDPAEEADCAAVLEALARLCIDPDARTLPVEEAELEAFEPRGVRAAS